MPDDPFTAPEPEGKLGDARIRTNALVGLFLSACYVAEFLVDFSTDERRDLPQVLRLGYELASQRGVSKAAGNRPRCF